MSPAGGTARARRMCRATTGFFVIEPCDRPARAGCGRCARSICARHMHALPGDANAVCPECYAAARGYVDDPTEPLWSVSYRRGFYWDLSTNDDPLWWDTFSEVDAAAFDEQGPAGGEGGAGDGDGDGGDWEDGDWDGDDSGDWDGGDGFVDS